MIDLYVKILISISIVSFILSISACSNEPPQTSEPLTRGLYVWQRQWNEDVRESITKTGQSSPSIQSLIVLAAEISFENGIPKTIKCDLDHQILLDSGVPIGLALRIGPYSGPFESDDEVATLISELSREIVTESLEHGIPVSELQIDFDCPDSKLDGYRVWINAIREKIDPVSVTITALPSWLYQKGFDKLVKSTDGFVLQVHSLEAPESPDSEFTLCDTERSMEWIDLAAKSGVPFRVALPTYGYVLAFDKDGKFIGLSAEGPSLDWPDDVQLRTVRSDPVDLADFVGRLETDHPALLSGIIWYRMPVEGDRLNWTWPTLLVVMDGRKPAPMLKVEALQTSPGLIDIRLTNNGDLPESGDIEVDISWENAHLIAFDMLRGVRVNETADNGMRIVRQSSDDISGDPVMPGQSVIIGWLRFETDKFVNVDVSIAPR